MEEGVYYVEILGCVIQDVSAIMFTFTGKRTPEMEMLKSARIPAISRPLELARHVQEDEGDLPEALQSGKSCKLYLNSLIHVFLPYRQRYLTARTMVPSPRIS